MCVYYIRGNNVNINAYLLKIAVLPLIVSLFPTAIHVTLVFLYFFIYYYYYIGVQIVPLPSPHIHPHNNPHHPHIHPHSHPHTPTIITPRDPVHEAFSRVAGSDTRIDSHELCVFLEDMSILEFGEPHVVKFPLESCRSLLAINDKSSSGYLTLAEVRRAWKEIKAYKELFAMFDSDHSGTVDTRELNTLFAKLGFPVGKSVLAAIVRRYGGRDSRISLADFVLVICKLTALFESFQQQQHHQHRAGSGEDRAEFTRNHFLQLTMGL